MYPKCGNRCSQRGRKRFIASWGLRMSHTVFIPAPHAPPPKGIGQRSKVVILPTTALQAGKCLLQQSQYLYKHSKGLYKQSQEHNSTLMASSISSQPLIALSWTLKLSHDGSTSISRPLQYSHSLFISYLAISTSTLKPIYMSTSTVKAH